MHDWSIAYLRKTNVVDQFRGRGTRRTITVKKGGNPVNMRPFTQDPHPVNSEQNERPSFLTQCVVVTSCSCHLWCIQHVRKINKKAIIRFYPAIRLVKDQFKKSLGNGVPGPHHLRLRLHGQGRKRGGPLKRRRTVNYFLFLQEFRWQEMAIPL